MKLMNNFLLFKNALKMFFFSTDMKNVINIFLLICFGCMRVVKCNVSKPEEERDAKYLKTMVSSSLNHPCK